MIYQCKITLEINGQFSTLSNSNTSHSINLFSISIFWRKTMKGCILLIINSIRKKLKKLELTFFFLFLINNLHFLFVRIVVFRASGRLASDFSCFGGRPPLKSLLVCIYCCWMGGRGILGLGFGVRTVLRTGAF